MSTTPTVIIPGMDKGIRVSSRTLEERIQRAVSEGHRSIEVIASGQHGIGGRLRTVDGEKIHLRVLGTAGQRIGAMGFPNTVIDVIGPASDDVGWLNAGAHIVVNGQATNGVGNAMAQGCIRIGGDIGARGMTMTKQNPRFAPPELWVLGKTGDSFAEFMAGGISVVCGHGTEDAENVLGYRPCVGMVGGRILFRGRQSLYSEADARLDEIDDETWVWLRMHLKGFLRAIDKSSLYPLLTGDRGAWLVLTARRPHEKKVRPGRTVAQFRHEVWDRELGAGGLIGDLTEVPREPIAVIATGDLRRHVPVWEQGYHAPPCQAACPTGIPVQERWSLIRQGHMDQAVDLALRYTPFPALICGWLCPNLCMQHCTRGRAGLPPVDVTLLGKASLEATAPERSRPTGKTVAVIGGGPAGLSVAWQLWLKGHTPVLFERSRRLGGKLADTIPGSRLPEQILAHELQRFQDHIGTIHLKKPLNRRSFAAIRNRHDLVVIATGAQISRTLPIPGGERAIPALTFLRQAKSERLSVGSRVVVIGAGNVGCDAATEAARLGATDILLVDIQEPASYGKERQAAEASGARFLWPRTVRSVTATGVELAGGESLPADTVIVAIGDQPDLSYLPEDIRLERGFVAVSERFQTSDPRVFAIGDAVRPGLLTEAIGSGRIAASAMDALLTGREETFDRLPPMDPARVHLEYCDDGARAPADTTAWAQRCASCGVCRDCGLCETLCPRQAIGRFASGDSFEYRVDGERCIGCGFCAGACPTGVWRLVENVPIE